MKLFEDGIDVLKRSHIKFTKTRVFHSKFVALTIQSDQEVKHGLKQNKEYAHTKARITKEVTVARIWTC